MMFLLKQDMTRVFMLDVFCSKRCNGIVGYAGYSSVDNDAELV